MNVQHAGWSMKREVKIVAALDRSVRNSEGN